MTAFFHFESDPIENFLKCYAMAEEKVLHDPHAITLATVSDQGHPSLRTVYYKGMVRDGFSFYTNYDSQKGSELHFNPRVAALFFWSQLEQQVRIEGTAEKMTRPESEAYFKTRPRLSQLGAWASHQSQVIQSYEDLQRRVQEFDKQFEGQDVPCPQNWGGFRILPLKIEFWFGKKGRLHERYVYERKDLKSSWLRSLRSP